MVIQKVNKAELEISKPRMFTVSEVTVRKYLGKILSRAESKCYYVFKDDFLDIELFSEYSTQFSCDQVDQDWQRYWSIFSLPANSQRSPNEVLRVLSHLQTREDISHVDSIGCSEPGNDRGTIYSGKTLQPLKYIICSYIKFYAPEHNNCFLNWIICNTRNFQIVRYDLNWVGNTEQQIQMPSFYNKL